jgi:hypothetical protein
MKLFYNDSWNVANRSTDVSPRQEFEQKDTEITELAGSAERFETLDLGGAVAAHRVP